MKNIKQISDEMLNILKGESPNPEMAAQIKGILKTHNRLRILKEEQSVLVESEMDADDLECFEIMKNMYIRIHGAPYSQWILDLDNEFYNRFPEAVAAKVNNFMQFLKNRSIPFSESITHLLSIIDMSYLVPGLSPALGSEKITENDRSDIESFIKELEKLNPGEEEKEVLNAITEFINDKKNII